MFIAWFAPQLSVQFSQPAAAAIIIGAIVVYSIVAVLGKYKDTPVGGGGTSTRKNVIRCVLKHVRVRASKHFYRLGQAYLCIFGCSSSFW